METQQATVTFFLDASRPNAQKKCLVKLNVYCKPNKKRYATAFHASQEEWEKINGAKLKDETLKDIKAKLNAVQQKAEKIIKGLDQFSFVAFEEAFFGNPAAKKDSSLKRWFDDYIADLKAKGRIGTADSYTNTFNSLDGFKKSLHLQDITKSFLDSYESYMLEKGRSSSTIGIYLRQLRAIINQAIEAGSLPQEKYPFKKYEIPTSRNVKKALSQEDVKKLVNHKPIKEDEQKAHDFWVFSYLCSGMNFADIIELQPSNVDGDYLHFFRAKTKNTKKKDLRPIKVGLNSRAKEIITRWKNTDPANPYLFPVLEAGLTPLTKKHRCKAFIKWVNKRMDDIRIELKIEQKVGTYVARHSFSTVLKRKGASTEFIKESLGHSSVTVTENYLDSFTDNVKLDYANLLTDL